ncbi:hypothetical protein GGR52DRAFT_510976 [Hypoxylon sp. FL1284]|nr:hypothetical protein GGR52DRAFT_510976 [Hypoxylon sp. FL1284]
MMASSQPDIDYSTVPAAAAPPGMTSNLIDPPSNAQLTKRVVYITLPIIVVCLMMRIYASLRISRKFHLDDYMYGAGCLFSFCHCAIIIDWLYDDVFGRHYWDIPVSAFTDKSLQEALAISVLYCAAGVFIKLSLLTLYYRIFRPSRYTAVLVWVGIVLAVVPSIALIIIYPVISMPRAGEGGWFSPAVVGRNTKYSETAGLVQGIVGAVTDVYILIIPLVMIFSLHLSTTKKLGIASIFAVGSLACAFSLMNIHYRQKAYLTVPYDPLWLGTYTEALAVAELNIGLMCSSVPVIFVLFKWPVEMLKATWSSVRSYPKTQGSQESLGKH